MKDLNTEQKLAQLTAIEYPNNQHPEARMHYRKSKGYDFQIIIKNGEMAGITWIQVWDRAKNELVAEIKESVCDLYYNQ